MELCYRKLTEKELTYINKWQNEYKATEDDVKKAFEITVDKTGKLAFAYMDAVLRSMLLEKGTKNEGTYTPQKKTKSSSFTPLSARQVGLW